ncbi:MAG: hypothetical protein LVR00_05915 [Rhabdochlamydiaceae bacterium]|jgi:hypothetical protein
MGNVWQSTRRSSKKITFPTAGLEFNISNGQAVGSGANSNWVLDFQQRMPKEGDPPSLSVVSRNGKVKGTIFQANAILDALLKKFSSGLCPYKFWDLCMTGLNSVLGKELSHPLLQKSFCFTNSGEGLQTEDPEGLFFLFLLYLTQSKKEQMLHVLISLERQAKIQTSFPIICHQVLRGLQILAIGKKDPSFSLAILRLTYALEENQQLDPNYEEELSLVMKLSSFIILQQLLTQSIISNNPKESLPPKEEKLLLIVLKNRGTDLLKAIDINNLLDGLPIPGTIKSSSLFDLLISYLFPQPIIDQMKKHQCSLPEISPFAAQALQTVVGLQSGTLQAKSGSGSSIRHLLPLVLQLLERKKRNKDITLLPKLDVAVLDPNASWEKASLSPSTSDQEFMRNFLGYYQLASGVVPEGADREMFLKKRSCFFECLHLRSIHQSPSPWELLFELLEKKPAEASSSRTTED